MAVTNAVKGYCKVLELNIGSPYQGYYKVLEWGPLHRFGVLGCSKLKDLGCIGQISFGAIAAYRHDPRWA